MEQREAALVDRLASEGVSIAEGDIKSWGFYSRPDRLIVLRRGLTGPQRLAALTHEAIHHWAGHDGHQSAAVEAWVNRQVAQRLVATPAYIAAERLHPGSVAGIAHELDLPVWVVEAYRSMLARAA